MDQDLPKLMIWSIKSISTAPKNVIEIDPDLSLNLQEVATFFLKKNTKSHTA